MTPAPRSTLIFCFLLCLLPLGLAAQQPDALPEPVPPATGPAQGPAAPSQSVGLMTRVRGLFDIDLPNLNPPGTFELVFNPHVSDLVRRGYLRTTGGLRWTVNDHLSFDAEADTYVNTRQQAVSYGYGVGQARGGVKYVFMQWPKPEFETSVGFDTSIPVGHPPIDMTDGLNHFTPNFVVQYHPPTHPRWTTFAGTSVDLLYASTVRGTIGQNLPHDDSIAFNGGAVYDMGQLKWTLQTTYTTTAVISNRPENFFDVRPSVLWFVPRRFTLNYKTQWVLGLGVHASWGPDGFYLNTNGRIRAEITFRQFLQNIRQATQRE